MRRDVVSGATPEDWEEAKRLVRVGQVVTGVVEFVMPFGLFVRIPGVRVGALLLAVDLDPAGTPLPQDEWPSVNDEVVAVVVDLPDWKRQVALSRRLSAFPSDMLE